MGLESATYIGGLTPSWPLTNDLKSQGDDHIRLIKATLQATFPSANKPFRLPGAEVFNGANQVLDVSDMNNTQMMLTDSGAITVLLPSLGVGDGGWRVDIVKISANTNDVFVSPPSGTIVSAVGATANIRIGIPCQPTTFIWTGGTWVCLKPGPPIASLISYAGSNVLPGYLEADGGGFSSGGALELFAVLGTTVLPDYRGRAEFGPDSGAGRLTGAGFGTTASQGAVGGAETVTLTTGQIPSHTHGNSLNDPGHVHGGGYVSQSNSALAAGGNSVPTIVNAGATASATTGITINNAAAGGGGAHANVPPGIIQRKLIRMC